MVLTFRKVLWRLRPKFGPREWKDGDFCIRYVFTFNQKWHTKKKKKSSVVMPLNLQCRLICMFFSLFLSLDFRIFGLIIFYFFRENIYFLVRPFKWIPCICYFVIDWIRNTGYSLFIGRFENLNPLYFWGATIEVDPGS